MFKSLHERQIYMSIHDYDQRLKRVEKSLKTLSKRNFELISNFENYLFSMGISVPRVVKYIYMVKNIAKFLGKDLDKADKKDIEKIVAEIERSNYAAWTKHDYRIVIRKFYKWLRNTENPPEIAWIKPRVKINQRVLPEQLPTQEEVLRMVEVAGNPRDRALIITLYESGARVGEIGNMRVKDVEFKEKYTVLRLKGKTGPRRIIVVLSTPYLQTWLKYHPLKDDPEAPLWVKLKSGGRISYQSLSKMLKNAALKAGVKKRVYPHLLRHARATELAKTFTEFQLSQYLGWVPNTRMASVYVHLAGRDLDNAVIQM